MRQYVFWGLKYFIDVFTSFNEFLGMDWKLRPLRAANSESNGLRVFCILNGTLNVNELWFVLFQASELIVYLKGSEISCSKYASGM